MKFNRKNKISNKWQRSYGGAIALITSIPFASFISVPFILVGPENNFQNFVSKIIQFITFDVIQTLPKNARILTSTIIHIEELVSHNKSALIALLGIANDNKIDVDQLLKVDCYRESIRFLLTNKQTLNSIELSKELVPNFVDFNSINFEQINNEQNDPNRIQISTEQFDNIKLTFAKKFSGSIDNVGKFLKYIFKTSI